VTQKTLEHAVFEMELPISNKISYITTTQNNNSNIMIKTPKILFTSTTTITTI